LSSTVDLGLTVEPARDGGFVVKKIRGQNYIWEILFAGKLGECLAYVGEHYSIAAKQ